MNGKVSLLELVFKVKARDMYIALKQVSEAWIHNVSITQVHVKLMLVFLCQYEVPSIKKMIFYVVTQYAT